MKQPKPDSVNYPTLLQEIGSGVVKIPDFQRPVVWDIGQTLFLLDSIARGFPIGTFILWESQERMKSHRNIGNLPLREVPEGRMVNYVLDGQQRITSLYACLMRAEIDGKKYEVYCDLDAPEDGGEMFALEAPDSQRYVSLADILGDNPHIVYDRLTPARKLRFNAVREAFRLYMFAVIRVTDLPLDTVCEIFSRINNTGTELDVFDLMVAKTWSDDFNLRDKYDDLVRELERVKFEGLSPAVILQAVSCVIKKSCTRKAILSISRTEMRDAWDGAIQSIRLAVDFLRDLVGVPVWRLLPYQGVVAPLTYFFHANEGKAPTAEQTEQLLRFFWRAGLSGRYTSGTESKIGSDLLQMDAAIAGREADFRYPVALSDQDLISCPLSLSNSFCKAVLCYLASRRPRNFENNGLVNLENSNLARSNSRQFHHFFPRKHLERKGVHESQINSVVNICLIPADSNLRISDQPPLQYLTALEKSNSALRTALQTHAVDDWDAFGITKDDYDKFLESRSRVIRTDLESLVYYGDEIDNLYGAGNEEFPSDND